jgi:hypothetical protein
VTAGSGPSYNSNLLFNGYYQQNEWSTSSTTYATGISVDFTLNLKDQYFGVVWVSVEVKNAFCRGLAQFIEGKRELP